MLPGAEDSGKDELTPLKSLEINYRLNYFIVKFCVLELGKFRKFVVFLVENVETMR